MVDHGFSPVHQDTYQHALDLVLLPNVHDPIHGSLLGLNGFLVGLFVLQTGPLAHARLHGTPDTSRIAHALAALIEQVLLYGVPLDIRFKLLHLPLAPLAHVRFP